MNGQGTVSYSEGFFARQSGGSLASARLVAPLVVDLIHPRSVVDVGCGVGAWLRAFRDLGCGEVRGVDGDWVPRDKLMIDPAAFVAADLAHPPNLGQRFDLAISVEVGEHLPAARSRAFVEYLTGLSEHVLWSAAIPFQGGSNHINERWPDYWFGLFAARGYVCFDLFRARFWNHPDMRWWYAQNLLLYVTHAQLAAIERATGAVPYADSAPPCFVHPERYASLARNVHYPELITPRKLVSAAIKSARQRLRARRKVKGPNPG
ncbi:MAG: class I SAM-dependent methyltransferase [Betaproteobacteria bacterium]|nr:class I SAM-dependent methyltransferase [Betaproteobacteria bacterium]